MIIKMGISLSFIERQFDFAYFSILPTFDVQKNKKYAKLHDTKLIYMLPD